MRTKIFALVLSLFIFTLSCKEDSKLNDVEADPVVSTFYFIRHAEKDRTDPENRDPELSQKGLGRAMHWAEILNQANIDAVYSTDYDRTKMTAQPMVVKNDLVMQFYDPSAINVEEFKANNLGKNVLVVGHSNTTPDFVNQMIGQEKYAAIDDNDNGSLFIVQQIDEMTTDLRLNFSCNCPD